ILFGGFGSIVWIAIDMKQKRILSTAEQYLIGSFLLIFTVIFFFLVILPIFTKHNAVIIILIFSLIWFFPFILYLLERNRSPIQKWSLKASAGLLSLGSMIIALSLIIFCAKGVRETFTLWETVKNGGTQPEEALKCLFYVVLLFGLFILGLVFLLRSIVFFSVMCGAPAKNAFVLMSSQKQVD
ncbi:MAG TPA: hypothetical protein PLI09_18175, partial [Candidatus Hydrogenedentes bacterium]|nr:hypothetical protein [Candidatus Hydrogenedentota bacterium]